ncbi:MAG: DUF1015 domain-containing protein [Phycisphaerae bacterium]|nr:DUF1015 domain-containing protein [Phycisphaerae bacterium]
MAEFQPFRAIRYNTGQCGHDWSSLIAPPYDVLTADDKAALLAQSSHNVVAIDLPFVPPTQAGPAEVYQQAATTLKRMRDENVLIQEEAPSLYAYHQQYEHNGHGYTRRVLFAAMRLEAFSEGTVFPHELTHGGPKEDRLALMRATRCQLSPVFALFSDPSNSIASALNCISAPPEATAQCGDVTHHMWVERDADTIAHIKILLDGSKVFIADGHHRYQTALNYRDELARAGALTPDHPANFVLVGLCAMEDPGCIILPTHRVLSGLGSLTPADVLAAWKPACTFTPIDHCVPPAGDADITVFCGDTGEAFSGRFTDRARLAELAPDRSKPWRALDLAYLHRYMIEELLITKALGGAAPSVGYTPVLKTAQSQARETGGLAIVVKPSTMAELRAVAQAQDFMPQKSTYFYPKLATGLVLHPLA